MGCKSPHSKQPEHRTQNKYVFVFLFFWTQSHVHLLFSSGGPMSPPPCWWRPPLSGMFLPVQPPPHPLEVLETIVSFHTIPVVDLPASTQPAPTPILPQLPVDQDLPSSLWNPKAPVSFWMPVNRYRLHPSTPLHLHPGPVVTTEPFLQLLLPNVLPPPNLLPCGPVHHWDWVHFEFWSLTKEANA